MFEWFELLCSDLARGRVETPKGKARRRLYLLSQVISVRGLASVGFRSATVVGRRSQIAGALLKQLTQIVTGADVDFRATIGPGLYLPHPCAVVIAPGSVIGPGCTIHSCVTLGGTDRGAPYLGPRCNISPGARIIGPVELGARTRVYPNAVVTRSFVDGGVVLGGTPAEILRSVRPDDFR